MADKATEAAQAAFKAQNEIIVKGLSAAGAGFDQMTGMAKSAAEASQVEAHEARKTWEQAMQYAQTRGGKVMELAKGMTVVPESGDIKMSPETRELAMEILNGDAGFYGACADYIMGMEKRQVELMAGTLKTNTALMESGQEMVKSAFDYGQALMDWSMAIAKAPSTSEQD